VWRGREKERRGRGKEGCSAEVVVGAGERERQGVGVGVRGLEVCGQSIDMAGKEGGRREGAGQSGEVGGREEGRGLFMRGGGWRELARERQGVRVGVRGMEACGRSIDVAGEEGGRREGVDQSLQAEYRHVRLSK
jgi:hypothetical protein